MTEEYFPTRAEVVAIGRGFLDRTFPASHFHHREHLITAVYVLTTFPQVDWRVALPDKIRLYNEAHGGVNSDTAGYHHTITIFHLDLVERLLASTTTEDLQRRTAVVLASCAADAHLMLRFYTRERLFSVDARRGWLDPDLQPIDLDQLLGLAPLVVHEPDASCA